MTDATLAIIWIGVLAFGLGFCMVLRRLGVPMTYVRDVLHVGAGIWPLGWPFWGSGLVPCGLAIAVAALAAVAPRAEFADKFRGVVSGGGERWSSIVLYGFSFAGLTIVAFEIRMFPAAAALMALALGDGMGGLVGRKLGRNFFSAPGGKRKSLEGSLTVAAMASLAVYFASRWFSTPLSLPLVLLTGVVAAAAEAVSPEATDNVLVPVIVWIFLTTMAIQAQAAPW